MEVIEALLWVPCCYSLWKLKNSKLIYWIDIWYYQMEQRLTQCQLFLNVDKSSQMLLATIIKYLWLEIVLTIVEQCLPSSTPNSYMTPLIKRYKNSLQFQECLIQTPVIHVAWPCTVKLVFTPIH